MCTWRGECNPWYANRPDSCGWQPKVACGDGTLWPEREECDDGNTASGDGCTRGCEIEFCGDGVVGEAERCDDGNGDDLDGCTTRCEILECGNGIVDGQEECDDANLDHWDTCRNDCALSHCRDGVRDWAQGEECDDGNDEDRDWCSNRCREAVCGDGIVAGSEQCDTGFLEPLGCNYICVFGDGVWGFADEGEECDDGDVDEDPSSDTNYCGRGYVCNYCGDGRVWSREEQCDEFQNTDTCNNCQVP